MGPNKKPFTGVRSWGLRTRTPYTTAEINTGDVLNVKGNVAAQIIRSLDNSPSAKRIFASNEEIVSVSSDDLYQLVVDFIIEQGDADVNRMSEGRYLSIEYMARYVFRMMMSDQRFKYLQSTYVSSEAQAGSNIGAADVATYNYMIGFRKRKVLTSRKEFLDLAYTYYSRVFTEIPDMPDQLIGVIKQVTPLVEIILVPFSEAKNQAFAQMRRGMN